MRDLVLLGILPFILYAIAKRPFIGLGMWIWTALFFPNAWVYGPASYIRYNLLFTGVTILSYLAMRKKAKFQPGMLGAIVLLFFAWTTISTILTVAPPATSWDIWSRFAKVIVLFIFVQLVVEKKLHLDFFLWCVVLSVGWFGCLEALKFIASGGGHKIEGFTGHVLGDRNELSLAFVMTLPICYYLLGQYRGRSRLLTLGLLGTMCLLVVAVIGTQSRGGFIAMAGFGAYLFLKTKHKIPYLLVLGVLGFGLSMLVSEEWTSRMNSIDSAAADDSSFLGRLVSWKMSFMLAVKHPFFGGGFKSLEYYPVWAELSREFFSYSWFYTGDALPRTDAGRAAHSIYFQVLSEQGFGGLLIFLIVLGGAFFKAGAIARKTKRLDGPEWIGNAATMLQLSIFAYALGGAALSLAYFELFYAIIALLIVLDLRILPAALAAAPAVREQPRPVRRMPLPVTKPGPIA